MPTTLNLSQAQAQFRKLARGKKTVAVLSRDRLQAFIVPKARMEALIESLEMLANQGLLKAIAADKAGKIKYLDFDESADYGVAAGPRFPFLAPARRQAAAAGGHSRRGGGSSRTGGAGATVGRLL
jgi:hypothetical protein